MVVVYRTVLFFVFIDIPFLTTTAGSVESFRNVQMILLDDNQPYYSYDSATNQSKGLLVDMFHKDLITICNKKVTMDPNPKFVSKSSEIFDIITTSDQKKLYKELNYTGLTDEIVIVGTSTYSKDSRINAAFHKRRVLSTKPVLIVKSGDLLLLVKFFRSFQRCFVVVLVALMVSVVIAAIIWTIEHFSGNVEFKENPASGLWTTFWFTIVTMTTVGYGDKTPKHPLSRIVTIVWILFGLMLVGLITAAAWMSLNEEYRTKNQKVAVVARSGTTVIVRQKLHAEKFIVENYNEVLESVYNDTVQLGLIDQYAAAKKIETGHYRNILGMERVVEDSEMKVRIFLLYNETILDCEEDENDDWKDDTLSNLMLVHIPPYEINNLHVRSLANMFDNTDRGLVLSVTIAASVVIVVALLSEVVIRLRNKSRKAQCDGEPEKDDEGGGFQSSEEYRDVLNTQQQFNEIISRMRKQAVQRYRQKQQDAK